MSNLNYLIFLGCVIPYRVSSYEISARKVLSRLSVELVEMPEFYCCGFPIEPVNHEMMVIMAARSLCLAEQRDLDVMTLCSGCFGILNRVNKELKEDKKLRDRINGCLKEINVEFEGTIDVKHLIHVLEHDVGFEAIEETIQKPLTQLRLAQHTGCHLIYPKKCVSVNNPEKPFALERLIKLTGAECLNYVGQTECCGNPIIGVNTEIPFELAREKLNRVKGVGAQALITVCPFCHMMYDLNQPRIESCFEKIGLPVLHYPQLLGLAMGIDSHELALEDLRVKPSEILRLV